MLLPTEAKRQLESIAVNELKDGIFVEDVILTSKSYLIERDERELKLLKTIEELKVK